MVTAINTTSCFANKTQAAGIVTASLQWLNETFLLLPLGDVLIVEVTLFEVPNWRPSMLSQMCLVFRVQRFQQLGSLPANVVVVGRQIRQAPIGQLVGIVYLPYQQKHYLFHLHNSLFIFVGYSLPLTLLQQFSYINTVYDRRLIIIVQA